MFKTLLPLSLAVSLLCACTTQSQLKRWYGEALESGRSGSDGEAGEIYQKIIDENRSAPGAHNNLAVLDVRAGKLDTALERVRVELELNPGLEAARINEVLLLASADKVEEAKQKALGLVGSFPDSAQSHHILGLVLVRSRSDGKRAEAALSRAIELGGSHRASAYFARGVLRARAGQPEESVKDFKETTKLRQDAVAHYNRGLLLAKLGRHEGAISDLRIAASLDPSHAAVPHLIAELHHRLKQPKPALQMLDRAAELEPKRPGLHLLRGLLHYERKDYKAAIKSFRAELEISEKWAVAHYNLGLALMMSDQLEEARSAFATAASLDPKDKSAARNRDALVEVTGAR